MAEQMVFDSPYGTVWVDPADKIVHHQIKKWVKGEDLRQILNEGHKQMELHKCTKWLSDDRNNSVLPQEDEAWAKEEWFPKVLKAGWKHWAIVMPEKAIGKMNMERFRRDYNSLGITAQAFTDPAAALEWLKSV